MPTHPASPHANPANEPTLIFSQKLVDRCHILLPTLPTSTSAIHYEGRYYAYISFFNGENGPSKSGSDGSTRQLVLLTRISEGAGVMGS